MVVLIAVTSGLLSVLLAVAVNVATGGTLPAPLAGLSWLAWPAVALLALVAVWLAIWQQHLVGAELPIADPRPVAQPPAELPAPPTVFDRADDLAAIGRLIEAGRRVVAIVGPPGAGKSSLALRLAHDRRHHYPDGQLFTTLRGADADPVPPEAVLIRFLGALGVPDDERRGSADDLAARFRSALAGRKMLIVLDDAHSAGQVQPLLPGAPGCLVLVTSRRLLTELPDATLHLLSGLDAADALALLADAAGEAKIAADPEGAARIVELCGGLPLAIRIAGARLRARPAWRPTDLAGRLEDERRRLDELRLRDQAVRSSFAASYRELPSTDRLVFRRAGAHPGKVFGVAAATALAGLDEPAVAAALERLVDAQLVESPAPDRYRLHDLLRLFATERLVEDELPGDRGACLARLLDWLTSHARAGVWLAEERDNVVAAVHRGVEWGAYERVWALVSAVHPLLTDAGDHPDRLALWRDAADAAAALGDDRGQARALRWVSNDYLNAGEGARALDPAIEAVAIAERMDDHRALAEALYAYGEVLRDLNRFDDAQDTLSRALSLFAEAGDVDNEIEVRNTLATLYNTFRRPELAVPVLERALALLPAEVGHRHAWALLQLSTAYKLTGRHDEAVRLVTRVFDISRRIGDEFVLAYALQERGWLAHDEGRYDDATRNMQEMLAVAERIRHGTGVGSAHAAIGEIDIKAGRFDEALRAFDAAIAQFERLRDRMRTGQSRLQRAGVLAEVGRTAEARAEWAAGEQLLDDTTSPDVRRLRDGLRERLGEDVPTHPQISGE